MTDETVLRKPDQVYSYGLAFIAERTGTGITMYKNLAYYDHLTFKSEEKAIEQMAAWEALGDSIQVGKK